MMNEGQRNNEIEMEDMGNLELENEDMLNQVEEDATVVD